MVPGPGPGRLPSSQSCRLRSETAAHLRIALSQALMLSPDGEKPPTRPRTPTLRQGAREAKRESSVTSAFPVSSQTQFPVNLTGENTGRKKKSPSPSWAMFFLTFKRLHSERLCPPRALLAAGLEAEGTLCV